MWHFRLQALSDKKRFLQELLIISTVIHCILVTLLCVMQEQEKITIQSTANHDASVIFVPTLDVHRIQESQKKIVQNKKNDGKKTNSKKVHPLTHQSSQGRSNTSLISGVNELGSLQRPITFLYKPICAKIQSAQKIAHIKKSHMLKQEKKQSAIQSKKDKNKQKKVLATLEKPIEKKQSQKEPQKSIKKVEEKKVNAQPENKNVNVFPFKKYISMSEPGFLINSLFKKDLLPSINKVSFRASHTSDVSVVEKKMVEAISPVIENSNEKNNTVVADNENINTSPVVSQRESMSESSVSEVHENVVYVSPKEYSAIVAHQELQQALSSCWKKPVGVKKIVSADVMIMVDASGVIIKKQFKKSSGIPIYDASIDRALETLTVPESLKTKTITITFTS